MLIQVSRHLQRQEGLGRRKPGWVKRWIQTNQKLTDDLREPSNSLFSRRMPEAPAVLPTQKPRNPSLSSHPRISFLPLPEHTPKSHRPGVPALPLPDSSPPAGPLCGSRPQEFHLYNGEYDLWSNHRNAVSPQGTNTQCKRALSEVEPWPRPWPTQAITKMTNRFPRPGFSPLEARLRLPGSPPQDGIFRPWDLVGWRGQSFPLCRAGATRAVRRAPSRPGRSPWAHDPAPGPLTSIG